MRVAYSGPRLSDFRAAYFILFLHSVGIRRVRFFFLVKIMVSPEMSLTSRSPRFLHFQLATASYSSWVCNIYRHESIMVSAVRQSSRQENPRSGSHTHEAIPRCHSLVASKATVNRSESTTSFKSYDMLMHAYSTILQHWQYSAIVISRMHQLR